MKGYIGPLSACDFHCLFFFALLSLFAVVLVDYGLCFHEHTVPDERGQLHPQALLHALQVRRFFHLLDLKIAETKPDPINEWPFFPHDLLLRLGGVG